MKCTRCTAKSTATVVAAGQQVAVCTKCYNSWLDKKDEAVSLAFAKFFPTGEPKKKKAKTTESSPELMKALSTLLKKGK